MCVVILLDYYYSCIVFPTAQLARDKLLQESQSKSERIGELEKEVRELQTSLSQCQKEIRENESTRRKLHNIIQELKGVHEV